MDIKIYTSDGCGFGVSKLKELMERADLEYTEVLWQNLEGDTRY